MIVIIILDSINLARFVEYYLTGTTVPFPINRYPNVEELAEAALRNFSPRNLAPTTRLNTGALIRPVEALFQDEFYRSLHFILNFAGKVSSEWSGDGNGRIDFRITDPCWGIELLRDGDRLREHCERFIGNGRYTRWIQNGWIKDWLIIDCRMSYPHPYSKLFLN
jgi:hypothetical protein